MQNEHVYSENIHIYRDKQIKIIDYRERTEANKYLEKLRYFDC